MNNPVEKSPHAPREKWAGKKCFERKDGSLMWKKRRATRKQYIGKCKDRSLSKYVLRSFFLHSCKVHRICNGHSLINFVLEGYLGIYAQQSIEGRKHCKLPRIAILHDEASVARFSSHCGKIFYGEWHMFLIFILQKTDCASEQG